jgi:hypothetical protein
VLVEHDVEQRALRRLDQRVDVALRDVEVGLGQVISTLPRKVAKNGQSRIMSARSSPSPASRAARSRSRRRTSPAAPSASASSRTPTGWPAGRQVGRTLTGAARRPDPMLSPASSSTGRRPAKNAGSSAVSTSER